MTNIRYAWAPHEDNFGTTLGKFWDNLKTSLGASLLVIHIIISYSDVLRSIFIRCVNIIAFRLKNNPSLLSHNNQGKCNHCDRDYHYSHYNVCTDEPNRWCAGHCNIFGIFLRMVWCKTLIHLWREVPVWYRCWSRIRWCGFWNNSWTNKKMSFSDENTTGQTDYQYTLDKTNCRGIPLEMWSRCNFLNRPHNTWAIACMNLIFFGILTIHWTYL